MVGARSTTNIMQCFFRDRMSLLLLCTPLSPNTNTVLVHSYKSSLDPPLYGNIQGVIFRCCLLMLAFHFLGLRKRSLFFLWKRKHAPWCACQYVCVCVCFSVCQINLSFVDLAATLGVECNDDSKAQVQKGCTNTKKWACFIFMCLVRV